MCALLNTGYMVSACARATRRAPAGTLQNSGRAFGRSITISRCASCACNEHCARSSGATNGATRAYCKRWPACTVPPVRARGLREPPPPPRGRPSPCSPPCALANQLLLATACSAMPKRKLARAASCTDDLGAVQLQLMEAADLLFDAKKKDGANFQDRAYVQHARRMG
eukprot:11164259-Lingulodinium_polyedra.AAC.2